MESSLQTGLARSPVSLRKLTIEGFWIKGRFIIRAILGMLPDAYFIVDL